MQADHAQGGVGVEGLRWLDDLRLITGLTQNRRALSFD